MRFYEVRACALTSLALATIFSSDDGHDGYLVPSMCCSALYWYTARFGLLWH